MTKQIKLRSKKAKRTWMRLNRPNNGKRKVSDFFMKSKTMSYENLYLMGAYPIPFDHESEGSKFAKIFFREMVR